jgi:hypothetical protein
MSDETLSLEFITVTSRTVLGKTEHLQVASPETAPSCAFSNAKGNLREVQSVAELANLGENRGKSLRNALMSVAK